MDKRMNWDYRYRAYGTTKKCGQVYLWIEIVEFLILSYLYHQSSFSSRNVGSRWAAEVKAFTVDDDLE
ncbi:hypothetical protein ACTXT7_004001 [Hymenolepis weldensis]